jgi:hypothetical protein
MNQMDGPRDHGEWCSLGLGDEKCGQDETYLASVPIALNGMAWRLSWLAARPARRQFETALPIDRDVVILHGETHGAVPVLHRYWH